MEFNMKTFTLAISALMLGTSSIAFAQETPPEGETPPVETEAPEGIGLNVSAAAQAAARAEDRQPGSVAQSVLGQTPANDRAREAVANAGLAGAEGRARAEDARMSARANAASARDNAVGARDTAAGARQTAATAREQAQQTRDAASAARDNARNIPRPGRPR
jgi:hypothetical protein